MGRRSLEAKRRYRSGGCTSLIGGFVAGSVIVALAGVEIHDESNLAASIVGVIVSVTCSGLAYKLFDKWARNHFGTE